MASYDMIVLVDFDNLRGQWRSGRLSQVIDLLTDRLYASEVRSGSEVRFRLYGGWFFNVRPSYQAAELLTQISSSEFPRSRRIPGSSDRVMVHVELAKSLACDPTQVLTHTFRPNRPPRKLTCRKMPFDGCAYMHDCRLWAVRKLVQRSQCPGKKCETRLPQVLRRSEQKLVDSMMVADLAHYANNPARPVAVVSGDDDLWPGIRLALLSGVRVTHIVPDGHKYRSRAYKGLTTNLYSRVNI